MTDAMRQKKRTNTGTDFAGNATAMDKRNDEGAKLDRFLPVKQVAVQLGVSLRSVWRLLADGALHAVHVRRRVLVAESEVRAYMERLKQGGNGAAGVA